MTREILFLLVNYFHEEEVVDFIRMQLSSQQGVSIKILVCDNGSVDPAEFRRLLESLDGVLYHDCIKNLGYFGGAYNGLEFYLASGNSLPDWVVVSNTDVLLPGNDLLKRFFQIAAGSLVAAPAVHSTLSGHQQNPFSEKRYSLSRLRFLRLVYSSYLFYLVYQLLAYIKRTFRTEPKAAGVSRKVYALHGTFLAFGRDFFRRGGTLQYASFLFGEELFVAEQVHQMGSCCLYVPEIQIEHREHATTGLFKKPQLVKHLKASTDYLIREVYRG